MRFWWSQKEGGQGLAAAKRPVYFAEGSEIHGDLHKVGLSELESDVVLGEILPPQPSETDQLILEPWARRVGWVTAFYTYVEPIIRREWKPLLLEHEVVLERDPLWVALQPDRIDISTDGKERRRYVEFKSTISNSNKWLRSWSKAVQLHAGVVAASEDLDQPVHFAQVVGLMKGYEKEGKLRHPYVWAYSNGVDWQKDYHYGWQLTPTWEYPGGVVAWVRFLGEETALEQFPITPPIPPNPDLVADFVAARIARHHVIETLGPACQDDWGLRRVIFEQRFSKCEPAFGSKCEFLELCHNQTIRDNPIESGLFVKRMPHHELEVIAYGNGGSEDA